MKADARAPGGGIPGRRRVLGAALLLACGTGASRRATAQAAPAAATTNAVVVWDFDNQTPPGASLLPPAQLDYLRRALPELLTQTLMDGAGLAVVERQRLRDVLAEQKLAAGELADADARLRLGRIVGAARMVFGGYFALGTEVQVNVRAVDTATSRVVFSDEFAASIDLVMKRAEAVAGRLAHALGGGAAHSRGYAPRVWLAYDRALALSDAGQYDEAITALERLLAEEKDFTPAERQSVALLEKRRRR